MYSKQVSYSTKTNKVAGDKFKRRPTFNFIEMNIPIGSKLRCNNKNAVEVEVCSERKVMYKGKKVFLTPITKELLAQGYSGNPTPHWFYNNRLLNDIYNETYPLDED